ncbi:MAG: PAS domain-containing sensor histidine kinase [Agriterribacter sp.]
MKSREDINQKNHFLSGGGEMGKLTREKKWENTPLGNPQQWPQSLRTTLNILLNSTFPMFLWWGKELICFYNDAYRPSLGINGEHPGILGKPAQEAWPEIWEIIKPLIDQVLNEGVATRSENQLIPIYRNGKMEDVYRTFSYSPVYDEATVPAGVLVTCNETTKEVAAFTQIKESRNELFFAINAADLGTWDLNPATGKFVCNERLKQWFGLPANEEIDLDLALERIDVDERTDVINSIQIALNDPSAGSYEVEYAVTEPASGVKRYLLAKGKVFFDSKGVAYRFSGIMQDITEKVLALKKLEESEQKFRLLADSTPQLIWTSDEKGNINYYNNAVYDYSGLTFQDLQGDGWLKIVHPGERQENLRLWERSVSTGEDFIFEHRFRRFDGEYRWQLSRAIPQRDANGVIQMWVGTSTDIHEIKELDQQKDYFISMASHELKTPVTSLKGYTQVLQSTYENSGDNFLINSLNVINKQTIRLNKLISELLDLSKIKLGNLFFDEEYFDLNKYLSEVMEEKRMINPGFIINYHYNKPAPICADKDRIRQVMANLINNAVKYSASSNVIDVTSEVKGNEVIVMVKDNGIGILKKDQEKIFERFYRVPNKSTKTYPGFGIGLYIASEIVKRSNGAIGVISEPGKGSTFYFSLPLK